MRKINLPLDKQTIKSLKAGEYISLYGKIITGRDAAHKRLFDSINNNENLPININGETIFYVGPCFDQNHKPTGAGPTTSMRMDAYAPTLYDNGILASIGKGDRDNSVYESIKKNGTVYLAAIGGAGAIYANAIKNVKVLCYEDLGTEAIHQFEIENFPVIVAVDCDGNSIYWLEICL